MAPKRKTSSAGTDDKPKRSRDVLCISEKVRILREGSYHGFPQPFNDKDCSPLWSGKRRRGHRAIPYC
ncbi:hypothetical protein M513_13794 [Trichuris suis]|uniref:Uncharacterized protein n=1 Tax=Trichuris suis TaxID=68888 RepID=A0A085LK32_9BILA|nr:hypothetical protein M513_13794 [Trichuris suis]